MSEEETPRPRRVVVTRDGPYRVEGGLPLARESIVQTEYGEPVEWERGETFDARDTYELCRCGHSNRKPFCDSTHETIGFDGTETADRGASATRRDLWEGVGVAMSDDFELCTRAGFCGDRFTKVWQMIDHTSDSEVKARLMRMIDRCPSGRLEYSIPPDPGSVEVAYESQISVTSDGNEIGPYWLKGGVRIVSEDGTPYEVRNRQTLCRCGRSGNKPFCDGSHEHSGILG